MLKKRDFTWWGGANVVLLGLVSLLNDFSSEMILPILPMFIAALGGTGLTIGLIGGLISGMPELLKVGAGYWSDKIRNRKRFIFLGYFNSQVFKFLLIFAKSWLGVLIFTTCDKLGKGIRDAPRDALISESSPKHKGRAFGIQRAFDTTGAILGSLTVLIIVLALGANIGDGVFFRKIIFLSAIIGFCSLIPLFFVKEVKIKGRLRKKETLYVSISELSTKLKLFILVAGIFALANFSYMFFILRAQEVLSFGTNKIATTLMLYVLFNIFYAGLAIPFGKFSDKIGRRRILISGYLLFSLVCLGFLFFDSLAAYIVLFIFYGTVYAIVVGTQRAYVSDLSSESHRATALGFFQTTIGICAIISGIVAGMLYDLSFSYTFAYGFGLSLISGILFLVFRRAYK